MLFGACKANCFFSGGRGRTFCRSWNCCYLSIEESQLMRHLIKILSVEVFWGCLTSRKSCGKPWAHTEDVHICLGTLQASPRNRRRTWSRRRSFTLSLLNQRVSWPELCLAAGNGWMDSICNKRTLWQFISKLIYRYQCHCYVYMRAYFLQWKSVSLCEYLISGQRTRAAQKGEMQLEWLCVCVCGCSLVSVVCVCFIMQGVCGSSCILIGEVNKQESMVEL